VIRKGSPPRPRPRSPRPGAFFVRSALLAVCAGLCAGGMASAVAQVPDTIPPVPPDTTPPVAVDTIPPVANDTVPADTVPAEPARPPARLPTMEPVGRTGWAAGSWEWNRADLQRFPDLSLLHLLERIPGVTPVRVSSAGQPEAASVFGATTAAITYEIDGFMLDPLTAPTFDPSRFPLLALESVRVERRVTGATVRIQMLSPTDTVPQSIIEAGTGDLRTNLFRGTFLAPRVLGGALAVGFESLGSQTLAGGASTHAAGSLLWTWTRDDTGVRIEYHQASMDRSGLAGGLAGTRRDWVIRGRDRFGPVSAEAYVGASSVEDDLGDVVLREGTPQGGLRLRSQLGTAAPVHATAALRLRSHPRLPEQEVEVGAWAEPIPWLAAGVELVHGRWTDRSPTGRWSARGQAGPFLGLTAFAELSRATAALVPAGPPGALEVEPLPPDGIDLPRAGLRAGAEFQRGQLRIGAAAIRVTADVVPGFGVAFDPDGPRFAGGDANGFEVTARLPTGWAPLRVEGWFVGLDAPPTWPYLPAERWRAALVYHALPLPSGNLEIYARAEHDVRGAMFVPQGAALSRVDAYRASNVELTIRVLTVRAFLRWQNVFNRPFQEDLPGIQRPGQHAMYGVKWEFSN
jgi:hypothetical protein